jgi:hypothetical protein
MSVVLTRLFESTAAAKAAVEALEAIGVPHTDISLIASDAAARAGAPQDRIVDEPDSAATAHEAREGAGIGGAVGGVAGLLAGLGVIAIPGIGPVIAAGWIVTTIAGALAGAVAGGATGGLVGALTDAGVPEPDAHVYAEGVRRGETLVSARVDDDRAAAVEDVLDRLSGVTAESRGAGYRAGGWTAFDPQGEPYVMDDIRGDRETLVR